MAHRDIARRVAVELDLVPLAWAVQAISTSYERAKGIRAVGERADGWVASASKTLAVSVDVAFAAFTDPSLRAGWLGDAPLVERTASKPRTVHFDWDGDGSRVHVTIDEKSAAKSVVTVEHARLADAAHRDRQKAFWRQHLDALPAALAEGGVAGA